LTVRTNGAEFLAEGQSTTPLEPTSFSGKVSGKLADLAQLQPFVPRVTLPSVQGLTFSANVVNGGSPLTRVTDVTLHAGTSDLFAYVPGLTLTQLDIRSPRMDQPVTVQAEGNYADAPLNISGTLGGPSALIGGQAFPVDVSLAVAGATATAKGMLADPARVDGAELVVSARIPALASFAALVRRPLPDVKDIALDAHLAEAQGGLPRALH
jgi:AsmA protein